MASADWGATASTFANFIMPLPWRPTPRAAPWASRTSVGESPIAGDPGSVLATGSEYDRDLERAERLRPLVDDLGLESPLELALRFALAKPGLSAALVGVSDRAQVSDALRWAERGPLAADAVER